MSFSDFEKRLADVEWSLRLDGLEASIVRRERALGIIHAPAPRIRVKKAAPIDVAALDQDERDQLFNNRPIEPIDIGVIEEPSLYMQSKTYDPVDVYRVPDCIDRAVEHSRLVEFTSNVWSLPPVYGSCFK